MFKRIKQRIQDMRTIAKLISGADAQAHLQGEEKPGAEHFLLSAFLLPDGTARRAFERVGADPEQFQLAIQQQYSDALNAIGMDAKVTLEDAEPITTKRVFHESKPSGQALMKALYALKNSDKDKPLLGAHVVAVIASMEQGVAVRALRTMDIDLNALSAAVQSEIDAYLVKI